MIKYFIPAILSFALWGCMGGMYPNYSQTVSVGDFRKYAAEGFTISPVVEGFHYEPIAVVSMNFIPGKKKGHATDEKTLPESYQKYAGMLPKDFFIPDYDFMLSELVRQAKEMGADGLLGLKITAPAMPVSEKDLLGYSASGFAVKIKK